MRKLHKHSVLKFSALLLSLLPALCLSNDLIFEKNVTQIHEAMQEGKLSAHELVDYYLKRIKVYDGVDAVTHPLPRFFLRGKTTHPIRNDQHSKSCCPRLRARFSPMAHGVDGYSRELTHELARQWGWKQLAASHLVMRCDCESSFSWV